MVLDGSKNNYSPLPAAYFNEVEDAIADSLSVSSGQGRAQILSGLVLTGVSSINSGVVCYNGLIYAITGTSIVASQNYISIVLNLSGGIPDGTLTIIQSGSAATYNTESLYIINNALTTPKVLYTANALMGNKTITHEQFEVIKIAGSAVSRSTLTDNELIFESFSSTSDNIKVYLNPSKLQFNGYWDNKPSDPTHFTDVTAENLHDHITQGVLTPADPHPQYMTEAESDAQYVTSLTGFWTTYPSKTSIDASGLDRFIVQDAGNSYATSRMNWSVIKSQFVDALTNYWITNYGAAGAISAADRFIIEDAGSGNQKKVTTVAKIETYFDTKYASLTTYYYTISNDVADNANFTVGIDGTFAQALVAIPTNSNALIINTSTYYSLDSVVNINDNVAIFGYGTPEIRIGVTTDGYIQTTNDVLSIENIYFRVYGNDSGILMINGTQDFIGHFSGCICNSEAGSGGSSPRGFFLQRYNAIIGTRDIMLVENNSFNIKHQQGGTNTFDIIKGNGNTPETNEYLNYWNITDNRIVSSTNSYAFFINVKYFKSCTITHNSVDIDNLSTVGYGIIHASDISYNLRIADNQFDMLTDNADYIIVLSESDNNIISNNYFIVRKNGIKTTETGGTDYGTLIDGNVFHLINTAVNIIDSVTGSSEYVSFTNNTIGSAFAGVKNHYIKLDNRALIQGNTFNLPVADGGSTFNIEVGNESIISDNNGSVEDFDVNIDTGTHCIISDNSFLMQDPLVITTLTKNSITGNIFKSTDGITIDVEELSIFSDNIIEASDVSFPIIGTSAIFSDNTFEVINNVAITAITDYTSNSISGNSFAGVSGTVNNYFKRVQQIVDLEAGKGTEDKDTADFPTLGAWATIDLSGVIPTDAINKICMFRVIISSSNTSKASLSLSYSQTGTYSLMDQIDIIPGLATDTIRGTLFVQCPTDRIFDYIRTSNVDLISLTYVGYIGETNIVP